LKKVSAEQYNSSCREQNILNGAEHQRVPASGTEQRYLFSFNTNGYQKYFIVMYEQV
jgi:hypothetical protein